MDQIDFQLAGQRFRLTPQDVVARMAPETPEPVQTWAVEIQGRQFPVKQVLATATGVARNDFISHRARDLLRRLGFEVVDVTRETASPAAPAELPGSGTDLTDRELMIRIAALEAAVCYSECGGSDTPVDKLLTVAQTFESWLTR